MSTFWLQTISLKDELIPKASTETPFNFKSLENTCLSPSMLEMIKNTWICLFLWLEKNSFKPGKFSQVFLGPTERRSLISPGFEEILMFSYLQKEVIWGREGSKSQEKWVTSLMDGPCLACSLPLLSSANQRCWCQQPSDDSLSVKRTTIAVAAPLLAASPSPE